MKYTSLTRDAKAGTRIESQGYATIANLHTKNEKHIAKRQTC